MNKENRNLLCFGFIQLLVFAGFTIAVKEYGFEYLNNWFYSLTGYNDIFVRVSDFIGCLSLLLVAVFALCGLVQLIEGKSLKKVDRSIIVLGVMYVVILLLYILFDKLAVSIRPDGTEASYPSSHVLLFLSVNITAVYELRGLIKNEKTFKAVKTILIILTVAGVVFRLICGCHWLTDIFGSLLLSSSVISFFFALV